MTTTDSDTHALAFTAESIAPDEAELAAIAFLARYSGRTLDAYRHDLRNLFQWTADHGLPVLEATRAHLELYRTSMEERRLAPSTIDGACPPRAASTGSLTSTAASHQTRPSTFADRPCTHLNSADWTEESWAGFSSQQSGSIMPTPPWPCSLG